MTEVRNEEVQEAEYREMEAAPEAESPKVTAQVTISVFDNGQLDVSIPEGMPELKAIEIEGLARQVTDQLRDIRIANNAIEIFKQRLG